MPRKGKCMLYLDEGRGSATVRSGLEDMYCFSRVGRGGAILGKGGLCKAERTNRRRDVDAEASNLLCSFAFDGGTMDATKVLPRDNDNLRDNCDRNIGQHCGNTLSSRS